MDLTGIRKWRRRGFYSERRLCKILESKGYRVLRIPVSNPSSEGLPDVLASRNEHLYAFEVKNQDFYCYVEKAQIGKLFTFLDVFSLYPESLKHAIIAAHLGKKWVFHEVSRDEFDKLPPEGKIRVLKRDRGNWKP